MHIPDVCRLGAKSSSNFLIGTETTGKVIMMITAVTRSTIQGTVIVITTVAVGIALALIHHHVSIDIVLCHDSMLDRPPYKVYNQGSYGSWKLLKTLEFLESDFKALIVLEIGFWSLEVLDFLLNKIEKYQLF